MDAVLAFFIGQVNALGEAAGALAFPALLFAALALAAGGRDALRKAHVAAGEVRTNAILFAFDIVFVTPVLVLLLTGAGAFMQRNGLALPIDWAALPVWAVAFLAVFAGDFVGYWRHRLEHVAALWPAHAIHHSDVHMTWTTGVRFHPFNRVTTALIDTSLLALLGFPPWALAVNAFTRHYYGLFIHMDLPWTYGPFGRLFVSPAMHRWHHVRDAQGAGANFATVFSTFDQAFGTHHVPGPCDAPLGVREKIGHGAIAQLLWPFRAAWRWAAQRTRISRVWLRNSN